ncbi:MAG: hypothetical protein HYS59_02020 [Candidatus Vogelbacteria bacterium]|nr:hypothetical protein [Candidatus Vogelbacteria bacterium]
MNTNESLQVSSAIRFGYDTTMKNLWFFVKVALLSGFLYYAPRLLSVPLGSYFVNYPETIITNFISLLLVLIATFITFLVSVGLTHISVSFAYGADARLSDLVRHWRLVPKYLWTVLLASLPAQLIVAVAFLISLTVLFTGNVALFIVVEAAIVIAGVYIELRLGFMPAYIFVDTGDWGLSAVRKSWNATEGHVWLLVRLMIVAAILNILGALAFIVGLFITIPTTMLASAYIYKLLAQKNGIGRTVSEPQSIPSATVPQA